MAAMARLAAFCRRLLAFVVSLFTAACGSGPRTFVDVEQGDVHVDAAEVEGLRRLLAGSGLSPEQLGVEGELASDRGNWVEIDGDGHVWSVGLTAAPGLDGLEVLAGPAATASGSCSRSSAIMPSTSSIASSPGDPEAGGSAFPPFEKGGTEVGFTWRSKPASPRTAAAGLAARARSRGRGGRR
jgi:hypothetical protein